MSKLSRELRMGIHNRFDIEVVDVKTGKVKQKAQAFNVVCNNYFTQVLGNGTEINTIQFGSGSGTPSASDVGLFTYVGYARNDSTYGSYDTIDNSDEANGIWKRTIKRTISNAIYVNTTITEVGLASGSSGNNIVTHAMLQDMNGNPISIQHTSTDIINIYCSIYLHYNAQDSDIHLYNPADSYKATLVRRFLLKYDSFYWRMSYALNYGALSYTTGNIQSSFLASSSSETDDSTNRTATIRFAQVPTGKGNVNGFNTLLFVIPFIDLTYGTHYASLLVEIGKTSIAPYQVTGESVGVGDGQTTKFKTAFKMPYNANVYINGVRQTSGVQVLKRTISSISASSAVVFAYETLFVYTENVKVPKLADPSTSSLPAGATMRNDLFELGMYRINAANGTIKGSDDGETWIDVETSTSSSQMNQSGAHYRYYKNTGTSSVAMYLNAYDGYNIIFDNPPAQGDVITIDYTTDYIPKDSDHVLDVELTFTFGEYQGE